MNKAMVKSLKEKMKIVKWVNVIQLRLYYLHKSKWKCYVLKELFDSKEEAERNYSGCAQTVYLGASKVEFEIPDNINII